MSSLHKLKVTPLYFDLMLTGIKQYTLRLDDRGFAIGDYILFVGYDSIKDKLTGCCFWAKIAHILRNFPGLEENYCILSICYLDFEDMKDAPFDWRKLTREVKDNAKQETN